MPGGETSYWAEIRDSAANGAYKDHGGSRKNLNVTIKKDGGTQVPRTRRTRRTDAWARVPSAAPKHLSTSPRHIVDFLGNAPRRVS